MSRGGPVIPLLIPLIPLLLTGCAAVDGTGERARLEAPERPRAEPVYRVSVDPSLQRIDVRVCFAGEPPASLDPVDPEAPRCLLEAESESGVPIDSRDGKLLLDALAEDACLRYAVDVDRALGVGRRQWRRGDDLLLSPSLWLFRPSWPEPRARIEVELPAGVSFAAPWPRHPRGGHRLDPSAFHRPAHVVFGRFEIERWEAQGSSFELVQLDGELESDPDALRAWIDAAIEAAGALTGRFPVEHLLVVVVPVGDGPRPVAFGLVQRGGGASVMLLPHRNASPEALRADWVAVHELSHLSLPRLPTSSSWLAEGFATYYQEVLRTRAGLQSPEDGWRRLLEGFERGRTGGTERALAAEAAAMHETGAYLRVYWSGAAFFLSADVELRSGAGSSLDERVEALQASGWDRATTMSRDAFTLGMDDGLERAHFAPSVDEYAALTTFPEVEPLLAALGIQRDAAGEVHLDPDAPLAATRDAIMAPRLSAVSPR